MTIFVFSLGLLSGAAGLLFGLWDRGWARRPMGSTISAGQSPIASETFVSATALVMPVVVVTRIPISLPARRRWTDAEVGPRIRQLDNFFAVATSPIAEIATPLTI